MSRLRPPGAPRTDGPSSAGGTILPEPVQSKMVESSDYSLDTEFAYYCALLTELIPVMRVEEEKELANRWLTKLAEPTLAVKNLRDKRNRFLMMLCISLYSGHIQTPFNMTPPAKLPEIATIKRPRFDPPAWHGIEADWKEHLGLLAEMGKKLKLPAVRKCQAHAKQCSGGKDARGNFLDRQFEFFLYNARSYLRSLNAYPKLRVACRWLEALCQVDRNCCARAKGIRNDYMMALMSYLLHHQLTGPFRGLPEYPLESLQEAAKKAAEGQPLNRATGGDGHGILNQFPIPEEGAFAFISMSSGLVKKMGGLSIT
ncbi:conserved hypothetical protein [Culex quinquefasciatus]|uniref:DUF4485 domain-containing protein n=1 Tax=Culex quinquefasciatus TaxID=7176 RepID=B0WHM5_CULQU|nr:conserved hypothetical protein [Culex quinquefasciatus]|eukprot:XP_001848209.1 conserved hypothetical protein [Culex quinquefasciatus]